MLQIIDKLRHWWYSEPPSPPSHRRIKNYSSENGFHYQYHLEKSLPGDYLFVVWTANSTRHNLRITVPLSNVSARDRYALAKLRLFRAFDEHAPGDLPVLLEVTDTAALDAL